MWSKIMTGGGAFLAAICGGLITRHLAAVDAMLMAGFAVGIVWMSQSPALLLRGRVDELERKVEALEQGSPFRVPGNTPGNTPGQPGA